MPSRTVYEFEGFRLDTHTQSLLSLADGDSRPLKPKEFDALLFFVEHAGELVDKDTLMQALWPQQVVEENNLNQYVSALRRMLGEQKSGRRFIMNVRARGYRFIPDVMRLDMNGDSAAQPHRARSLPVGKPSAWQVYQQAVNLQNLDHPDRWAEAVTACERALGLDPDYGPAYALLALTRTRLYMLDYPEAALKLERALEEAQKAVALQPGVANGYMALGAILAARGEWVPAELNYLSARQIDTEWLLPLNMHSALVLLSAGHLQRALETGRRSLGDVQGITSLVTLHSATAALCNHDDEAREAMKLAEAMGAELRYSPSADVLSMLAQREGDFATAETALQNSLPAYLVAMGASAVIKDMFEALQQPSQTRRALASIDAFVAKIDLRRLPQSICKQILLWYTQLRALDSAFAFANRFLDHHRDSGTVGTAWGSLWLREMRAFREDPRFGEVATRIRLPDYWNAFGPPDGYLWQGGRLIPATSAAVS